MLIIQQDYRLGNITRPHVSDNEKDINMQIPDEIRKCVVFIAHLDKNNQKILKGTGFFVSIEASDKSRHFVYLVTARHITAKIIFHNLAFDNNIWIRINKKNEGFDFIPIPISAFIPHPDSVDVMVLPFAPDIKTYDYLTLPHTMLLNQGIIDARNVSLGDDVFMTGLFVRHSGKEKISQLLEPGLLQQCQKSLYIAKFLAIWMLI